MIYVSRTDGSGRIRPPRALPVDAPRPPARGRVWVALALFAVIASVLVAVAVLGTYTGPTA